MNFRMTSYADNFEDVLLRRAFPDEASGFYIDFGAYEPVEHSVTKHFYDSGWRGVNIEPNPSPFARLEAARPRDANLNIGLSDAEGVLTIYEAPASCWSVDQDILTGWFGADPREIRAREIPVLTLAQVCERHVPRGCTVDFLKVDVEGHEREVVAGGDWNRWRPRVVVAEANKPESWDPSLVAAGYHFVLFDGVNRFYVRDEDQHLISTLSVPVNAGDRFAIHGYMAVINDLRERLALTDDLGPRAIALARRLQRLADGHPRAASLARSVLRRLAG